MIARRMGLVALVLVTGSWLSACVPDLPLATGTAPAVTNCYTAMEQVWPVSLHAWARRIIKRESGGRPTAQNRKSSAAGCFQMLSMHAGRYRKLGYTWADRYDAVANVTVAYDLYLEQGAAPWRASSHK